jgi:hypothetical protein
VSHPQSLHQSRRVLIAGMFAGDNQQIHRT